MKVIGVVPFVIVKLKAVSHDAVELKLLLFDVLNSESLTLKVDSAVPPAPLQVARKSVASSWVAVAAAARRKAVFRVFTRWQ